MRNMKAVSMMVAGLVLSANVLSAQSANISATATVLSPIVVTAGNPLAFGNVTPGVAKVVAANAASAGTFSLVGQAAQGIQISFTLPTNLTSGVNNLPIGTWTGLFNTTNVTGSATAFTPSASATNGTTAAGTGNFFVWVGGTVTPAAAQAAGTYTGSVTMSVVYQ